MILDELLNFGEADAGVNENVSLIHEAADTIDFEVVRDLATANLGSYAIRVEVTEAFAGGTTPQIHFAPILTDGVNVATNYFTGGPGATPWIDKSVLTLGTVLWIPFPMANAAQVSGIGTADANGWLDQMRMGIVNFNNEAWTGGSTHNLTAGKATFRIAKYHGDRYHPYADATN